MPNPIEFAVFCDPFKKNHRKAGFFYVRVWNTRKQMNDAAKEESNGRSHATDDTICEGLCYSLSKKTKEGYLGSIYLNKQDLSFNTIDHEISHAALAFLRSKKESEDYKKVFSKDRAKHSFGSKVYDLEETVVETVAVMMDQTMAHLLNRGYKPFSEARRCWKRVNSKKHAKSNS